MEGRSRLYFFLSLGLLSGSVVPSIASQEESSLMKIVSKCLKADDIGICLRWKVASELSRLAEVQQPLSITDNIILIRNSNSTENLSTDEIFNARNFDIDSRENEEFKYEKLDRFIWGRIADIFNTRTVQIRLPRMTFEGRGQMDKLFKKNGMFAMFAMLGGLALKAAMTKVAFLAAKALVIAKIALVLSLIIGFRKFLGRTDNNAEVAFNSVEQEANGWMRRHGFEPRRSHYGASLAYNAHSKYKINQS